MKQKKLFSLLLHLTNEHILMKQEFQIGRQPIPSTVHATEKALSPIFRLALGTTKSQLLDEGCREVIHNFTTAFKLATLCHGSSMLDRQGRHLTVSCVVSNNLGLTNCLFYAVHVFIVYILSCCNGKVKRSKSQVETVTRL